MTHGSKRSPNRPHLNFYFNPIHKSIAAPFFRSHSFRAACNEIVTECRLSCWNLTLIYEIAQQLETPALEKQRLCLIGYPNNRPSPPRTTPGAGGMQHVFFGDRAISYCAEGLNQSTFPGFQNYFRELRREFKEKIRATLCAIKRVKTRIYMHFGGVRVFSDFENQIATC